MLTPNTKGMNFRIGKCPKIEVEKNPKAYSISEKLIIQSNFFQGIRKKIKNLFDGATSNNKSETVEDQINNSLVINKQAIEAYKTVDQPEKIASLKYSSGFSTEQIELEQNSLKPVNALQKLTNISSRIHPISTKLAAQKKGKILLICQSPLQKKILNNLMTKWGYAVDILSKLPSEIDLITVLDYQLIIVSKNADQATMLALMSMMALGQEFLLLSNGPSTSNVYKKQIPHIAGPIDPDFLKFKLEKMFIKFKVTEIQK